jgi:hypothetical protein
MCLYFLPASVFTIMTSFFIMFAILNTVVFRFGDGRCGCCSVKIGYILPAITRLRSEHDRYVESLHPLPHICHY